MEFWEKIVKDLEAGATSLSEKAGEWLKVGAEKVREGAEIVSEKAKDVTQFTKLKWTEHNIHSQLKAAFMEIGDFVVTNWANQAAFSPESGLAEKIQKVTALKTELERVEKEIVEITETLSKRDVKEMEKDLEEGGGTIKQVVISAKAKVCGKKIKEVEFPKDALIGTLVRNDQVLIPKGDTEFLPEDKVTILGKKEAVLEVARLLTE
jgi:exonuclease VII small subunit